MIGISEKAAQEWGQIFSRLLHYDKKDVKQYKKQALLAREADIQGDGVLYFLRDDKVQGGRPFDIVVTGGRAIDWEKTEGNYTLGIQHDEYGRRTGFWSATSQKAVPFQDGGNQVAIQFLRAELAGQLRGYSCFGSEIATAKNWDRIWDAILERMVLEATQVGWFNASKTDVNAQVEQMVKALASNNGTTAKELKLSADPTKVGGMYTLEDSEGLQFTDLKAPGNNFATSNEWTVKKFAMARGVGPNVLLGEYPGSYSAHRGEFNDFIRLFRNERHGYTDNVEDIVNREYLMEYVRAGELEVVPEFWTDRRVQQAYLAGVYFGPVPGAINPQQEANAHKTEVEEGFRLRSRVANMYDNGDFENMMAIREEEERRFRESTPEQQVNALVDDMVQKEEENNATSNS